MLKQNLQRYIYIIYIYINIKKFISSTTEIFKYKIDNQEKSSSLKKFRLSSSSVKKIPETCSAYIINNTKNNIKLSNNNENWEQYQPKKIDNRFSIWFIYT